MKHKKTKKIVLASKKLLILIITFLNIITVVYAQNRNEWSKLKADFKSELDSLRSQYNFPGATAACILPDSSAVTVSTGFADVENNIKMKPESRMLAASIGKTFVGTTVLALAQENILSLDDPISKWLKNEPWFPNLPNHNEITIRQLLNHTSGITNHVYKKDFIESFQQNWETRKNIYTPQKLITYILDDEALFEPGKGWSYSDTGYIIIGMIIEKATGNTYYEEVTERFLRPLKLTGTSPSNCLEIPNLASGYMGPDNIFNLPEKTTLSPGVMAWHPGLEWAGGGLVSNPRDLVIWAKSLFEGDAMKGDYREELLRLVPVSSESQNTLYGISIAVYKNDKYGEVYGHSGWIPGYSSNLRYYPEYKVGIAFQINTDIGIVDDSTQLYNDMEKNLTKILIEHIKK